MTNRVNPKNQGPVWTEIFMGNLIKAGNFKFPEGGNFYGLVLTTLH